MLFLLFSLAFSVDLTLYYGQQPETPVGELIQVVSGSSISDLLGHYLSQSYLSMHFYTNDANFNFEMPISIFAKKHADFIQLDNSETVNIALNLDSAVSDTYVSFQKVHLNLESPSLTSFDVESLLLTETTVTSSIQTIRTASLQTDHSISAFSTVNIPFSINSDLGVTLFDSTELTSISINDNEVIATINDNQVSFNFDSQIGNKRFDVNGKGSSKISVQCTGTSISALSFIDCGMVYFVGSWSESINLNVVSRELSVIELIANSTVLPVSVSGPALANITITQQETILPGRFESPIRFKHPSDRFLSRKQITIRNSYSDSNIDLGSSYMDLTIENFAYSLEDFGNFPFVFRVGTGGASTLTISKSLSSQTKKTGIVIKPDFYHYLSDPELENLLTTTHNILTITGMTFIYNVAQLLLPSSDELFIHGFMENDCCLSAKIQGNTVVLNATAPSLLPLNICYDSSRESGDCNSDDGIEINNIDQLPNYFEDGMKFLNLTLKLDNLNSLDLSRIDLGYSDVKMKIIGAKNTVVNQIAFTEGTAIVDLEIYDIALGTTTFYVKKVLFSGVRRISGSLSFKKSEEVIVDDIFMQEFASNIVSSIPKLTYQIDKYDAITFDDDKYIFYDISLNDFSDPITLMYSSTSFLNILYDVGMSETAKDNNLNLTMNTKNPPSFNVTFLPIYSQGLWEQPSLILYNWAQTKQANFTVYFIHNQLDVKITLTEPYRPAHIIPIGTGSVTYDEQYDSTVSYCVCPESYRASCPSGIEIVSFDDINDRISSTLQLNITLFIRSDENEYPSIDLYKANLKATKFIGLQSSLMIPSDVVEISITGLIDTKVTYCEFSNIRIKPKSGTTEMAFGELHLSSIAIDTAFKSVDITVDDFSVDYESLAFFKSVTITDNLIVDGELAPEEATVTFIPDNDPSDLKATISSSSSIVLGDLSIKIGKTTFKFGSLEKMYDIVLYAHDSSCIVDISRDPASSETQIPMVRILRSNGATFRFSNDWTGIDTRDHVFLFSEFDKSTIVLKGEKTPISFSGDGELTLIAQSEKVGVTGLFEYRDISVESTLNIKYENVAKSTITLSNYITLGEGIIFKFSQPNIELVVNTIQAQTRDRCLVEAVLYSDLTGDSKLTIEDPMINVRLSTEFQIEMPITAEVTDPRVASYANKNHTLVTINNADTLSLEPATLEFIGTKPTTHGFNPSNIDISINQITGDLQLYFKVNPITAPYTLCYPASSSCDIQLTDDNLNDISSLLPSNAVSINVQFGQSNTIPLRLGLDKLKKASVFITPQSSTASCSPLIEPGQTISFLSIRKVSAKLQGTVSVDRLEISELGSVNSYNGFKIVNTDYDSLKNIPSLSSLLIVNLSSAPLTFTRNGYKVNSDAEILSSNYPQIQFNYGSTIPNLICDSGLSQIRATTITTSQKQVIIDKSFKSVTSSSTVVNFNFEGIDISHVIVTTGIYPPIPFPQLMKGAKIQFDESILPLTVNSPIDLDGVTQVFDFSNIIDSTKAQLIFGTINFNGFSSLEVIGANAINHLTISNANINENAVVSILSPTVISNSIVAIGNSVLKGTFDVLSTTTVQLQWKLNSTPLIETTTTLTHTPSSIILKFYDDTIEGKENDYNDYLYEQLLNIIIIPTARCTSWKSVVSFESSVDCFANNGILSVTCNEDKLSLTALNPIPNSDSGGKKKLSGGMIFLIIFLVCSAVTLLALGILFYFRKKRKAIDLDTDSLDSLNKARLIETVDYIPI